jgi:hypothetical protein
MAESFFVVPLGLEPRLFGTKNRRVASYTIGQFHNCSFLLGSAKLATKINFQKK